MVGPPPLLRSPDFPGIAPGVAAVSVAHPCERVGGEDEPARLTALIDAIRAARVGGTFWARPVIGVPNVVLRPRSQDEARHIAAQALRKFAPTEALAILPDTRWARRATDSLAAEGIAVAVGDVDPWSVLRPGVTVFADANDEYALLAEIAGATPTGTDSARRQRLYRALIGEVQYRDPFTATAATADRAVAQLADWRRSLDANRGIAAATGIAWWKRRSVERFLWVPRARPLLFARSTRGSIDGARRGGGAIVAWPSRAPARLHERAAAAGVATVAMEDGFIRSIGLGSDLVPPLSVVLDRSGVHYDPSHTSDLETLLERTAFSPTLLARAEALVERVVRAGIGKYGIDGEHRAPAAPRGRRRVLVVGQVEDDQSVLLGGAGLGNIDLLRRARAVEPDAELWYRPHPDVVAGHRRGAIPIGEAARLADRMVHGGSMASLLDQVDGVHVLTSLAGFEALIRRRAVTTHGGPFYAGWGLTTDLGPPIARRTRRLTLAELVAATLILYPRYLDPVTQLPCPPEVIVARFVERRAARPSWLNRLRRFEGQVRRSLRPSMA